MSYSNNNNNILSFQHPVPRYSAHYYDDTQLGYYNKPQYDTPPQKRLYYLRPIRTARPIAASGWRFRPIGASGWCPCCPALTGRTLCCGLAGLILLLCIIGAIIGAVIATGKGGNSNNSTTTLTLPLTGPMVSGPTVSGPTVSGPTVSGPVVSGPTVSGPTVSGPTVSGPTVSGPTGLVGASTVSLGVTLTGSTVGSGVSGASPGGSTNTGTTPSGPVGVTDPSATPTDSGVSGATTVSMVSGQTGPPESTDATRQDSSASPGDVILTQSGVSGAAATTTSVSSSGTIGTPGTGTSTPGTTTTTAAAGSLTTGTGITPGTGTSGTMTTGTVGSGTTASAGISVPTTSAMDLTTTVELTTRPPIVPCPTEPVLIYERVDATEQFNRTWAEMKAGFGSEGGNYWRGLDDISALTQTGGFKLSVMFESIENGAQYSSDYVTFQVGAESSGYELSITGQSGNFTYDAFVGYTGYKFSTHDKVNDLSGQNCPSLTGGAWWYGSTCSCGACLTQEGEDNFQWKVGFTPLKLRTASMTLVCK